MLAILFVYIQFSLCGGGIDTMYAIERGIQWRIIYIYIQSVKVRGLRSV